jgi:hypothetical protein
VEGPLSEDPEQLMDVALSLDQFSMVEWPAHLIAAGFQERLPEAVRILFLEPGREGSRRRQNRLLIPTVAARAQQLVGVA